MLDGGNNPDWFLVPSYLHSSAGDRWRGSSLEFKLDTAELTARIAARAIWRNRLRSPSWRRAQAAIAGPLLCASEGLGTWWLRSLRASTPR